MPSAKQPIGIFDSGIGGLTVASAVKKAMPAEDIIYFGDTAHLPYGDKSTAAIQAYSIKITDLLLREGCKVILIACNSASAAAHDLIQEYVGKKAYVFNVIDPVIDHIRENYSNTRIGLIGTKQTIGSDVYKIKTDSLQQGIQLKSLATPLLVPMIEEGYIHGSISSHIIEEYLNNPILDQIRALILGCTHYPLIKKEIAAHYTNEVEIIDSAEIVARSLRAFLEYKLLINASKNPGYKFMVSDYTLSFEELTVLFFGKKAELEYCPLWSEQ